MEEIDCDGVTAQVQQMMTDEFDSPPAVSVETSCKAPVGIIWPYYECVVTVSISPDTLAARLTNAVNNRFDHTIRRWWLLGLFGLFCRKTYFTLARDIDDSSMFILTGPIGDTFFGFISFRSKMTLEQSPDDAPSSRVFVSTNLSPGLMVSYAVLLTIAFVMTYATALSGSLSMFLFTSFAVLVYWLGLLTRARLHLSEHNDAISRLLSSSLPSHVERTKNATTPTDWS